MVKGINYILYLCFIISSCANNVSDRPSENPLFIEEHHQEEDIKPMVDTIEISDTAIIELKEEDGSFLLNMKYATEDNFLKEKVYDCAKCLLRKKAVDALIKASALAEQKGYRIMFFDCYRPLYIQEKMWEIVNDPRYVANPAKGSIHNRGGAVDLTLADMEGNALDMGTKFDHFGKEAHHDYLELSEEVLKNREELKNIMTAVGFIPLNSEWWHYSLEGARNYSLGNTPIVCDE
ncbi:MAG TPA: D-alanyl-D-alanine dipeptidase [Flavobacteriales bacterium]|nr:D-alanyl-D-alanine dipeptidase [Flavobacteriales bacterium]